MTSFYVRNSFRDRDLQNRSLPLKQINKINNK